MLNNKKNKNMYVPPSQAVGKKRGRGWTRTIDPLINISRSATKATRPCCKNHLSSQTGG